MSARPMSVVIVDDEPIARAGLRDMLELIDGVDIRGEASNGQHALALVRQVKPDALFLDIRMPDLDGFATIAAIGQPAPAIVFVTAFEQYATAAFDADAVDYLQKPFDSMRVGRAVERIRRIRCQASGSAASETQYRWQATRLRFVVKDRGSVRFVEHDDVQWIESWGNYARLMVGGRALLLRESMASLETKLDPRQFIRVSRMAIVNARNVRRLHPKANGQIDIIMEHAVKITASRRHRERLQTFFCLR